MLTIIAICSVVIWIIITIIIAWLSVNIDIFVSSVREKIGELLPKIMFINNALLIVILIIISYIKMIYTKG